MHSRVEVLVFRLHLQCKSPSPFLLHISLFFCTCVDVQVSFSYKHVGQDDFSQVRADSFMFKGCSLGKVISTLGPDYSLLSWSYDKDVLFNILLAPFCWI